LTQGNILLADDNKLVVKITSAILEGAGYSVSVAWDGVEAINKAYTEQPEVLILDIEMPKINGYQVCRLLKDDEFTRDIPIVMLTGRERQSDMFWGMKTGAEAYIIKGFKPEQLLAVIEELLETGRARRAAAPPREGTTKPGDEGGVFSRVIDILDTKLFESTINNELGSLASLSQGYRPTVKVVLEILARVVGNSIGVVMMFEEEDLIVQVSSPVSEEGLERVLEHVYETAADYGWEQGAERSKPVMFGEEEVSVEAGEKRIEFSHVHIPLTAQKKVVGLLMLTHGQSPAFVRNAQRILRLVQNQVTIVIDNARLYEAARRIAITDGLTRLYNHRFFQELFEKEYKRSDRYNTVFSLIMLDIDYFKKINDTYGHLCGDEILKGLAKLIRGCLRSMDVVARYGGEEFAILLPETGGPDAVQTAERIRWTVEQHSFMGAENGLRMTVSQGVATYPSPDVHERFDIIAKADAALYEAKAAGRNRVAFKE
jgi:diguanylate cyclase (GGDEF)-like protein